MQLGYTVSFKLDSTDTNSYHKQTDWPVSDGKSSERNVAADLFMGPKDALLSLSPLLYKMFNEEVCRRNEPRSSGC